MAVGAEKPEEYPFSRSLHHTGEGMRYCYEEHGGFMEITKIPYHQLDCKSCHIQSCATCHAKKEGEKCAYTVDKAKEMDTCLACHSREKATFGIGKKTNTLDVHTAGGMVCSDCHGGEDVHGDGNFYNSMRDKRAVKASCESCHPPKEKVIRAHTVHQGKLDCAACHVSNSISCMNCHFDGFLKTGKREGNFIPPTQDWMLLVNYQGKVTSGSVQTLVYQGKKFIAYVPYFTHAIQAKGKDCSACHANEAVKLIQKGKSVPMAEFKDGKMSNWKGVVPLVPGRLEWPFLDRDGDKWVLIKSKESTRMQQPYGESAISEEQIKKLASPYKK